MKSLLLLWVSLSFISSYAQLQKNENMHSVLLVGNCVSGTVSVIDTENNELIGTINAIPDFAEVRSNIKKKFVSNIWYNIIRWGARQKRFEPSNGDRFLDDLFLSPDGSILYVSRSNLGDVAAFDISDPLKGTPQIWRTRVSKGKADHAALSPDGKKIAVSAIMANKVQIIDTTNGKIVSSFKTGNMPHQNDYSVDGKHIYNGSLGRVFLPKVLSFLKGPRRFTKADAETGKVIQRYGFEAGVRPTVITRDEKIMYAQLSYFNGVVKYDLVNAREIARAEEPLNKFAKENYPRKNLYPMNSAHHGLAQSGDGKKLCDAGTINNTVSIIDADQMKILSTVNVGLMPYWATTSPDGKYCYVSVSGTNQVIKVSYSTGKVVATVKVDEAPHRSRLGMISQKTYDALKATYQPKNL